jgi:PAS domain S-box-containing protein
MTLGSSESVQPRARERASFEADELFELATTHAAIGIAVVGADGRILMANPALTRLLGSPPEALIGCSLEDLFHPADREQHRRFVRARAAGDNTPCQFDRRLVHADGTAVWVTVSLATIRDESGGPRCALAQFDDISRRKAAQRELQEMIESLRADNRALSELAGAAAHELKSPLVSVHSLLELLVVEMAGQLAPAQRDLLDLARARVRELAARVDDLLRDAAEPNARLSEQLLDVADPADEVIDIS